MGVQKYCYIAGAVSRTFVKISRIAPYPASMVAAVIMAPVAGGEAVGVAKGLGWGGGDGSSEERTC
jgi:hypothetical protein